MLGIRRESPSDGDIFCLKNSTLSQSIRLWVENECWCRRTVDILNVNFTTKKLVKSLQLIWKWVLVDEIYVIKWILLNKYSLLAITFFLKFVSVIWLSKRQKAHFSVLIYTRNRCAQRLRPLIRNMMTSTNGNIFRATGPLCGEFTGHRWIPRQRPGTRSLNVSLICARINNHVNNREAGDLRRHG